MAKQSTKAARPKALSARRASRIRLIVQIFFFALIALIAVNHGLEEAGKAIPVLSSASLHAICPFGGVVSVYQFITTGTFVRKIHSASFILMWIVFVLTVFLGPVFCGWVCPFGSIQEWLGKLGRKIFKKRFNRIIPYKVDRILRYLRYVALGLIVYMTAVTGTLMFANIDPYFALFNFWTSEAAIGGVIVLIAVLLLSLLVERPFCKYACPYGALLGVFNLFRVFKIRRNPSTCINCKACDRACPMNIPVSTSGAVRNHQCITCLKCTTEQACPVDKTVELTTVRLETPVDKPAEEVAS
jgi:polyferredoxin